jgi:hypothetical protein
MSDDRAIAHPREAGTRRPAGRGPDLGRLLTRGRAAARATDAIGLDRKGAGMWGKRDDMVVHDKEPFNAEPPPAALAAGR